MPSCQDDDDCAASMKTGADSGLVLVPQLITIGQGLCLGPVLDWVIYNQKVGAVARDRAADADRNHAACAIVEVPVGLGGLHLRNGVTEQDGAVFLHLIPVLLAELLGQIAAITDLDDTLFRVLTKIERREGFCHGHRLTVTGRHEYHQPLCLACHNIFQLSTYEVEVSGSFPPTRMDKLDIICVVSSRQLVPCFSGDGLL